MFQSELKYGTIIGFCVSHVQTLLVAIGVVLVGFIAFVVIGYMQKRSEQASNVIAHGSESAQQSMQREDRSAMVDESAQRTWSLLSNRFGAIAIASVVGGILFIVSLRYGRNTSLESLKGSTALIRSLAVFGAVLAFGAFDRIVWHGSTDRYKYFFACVLGTLASWVIIVLKRAFFETAVGQDPFLMALGIICIIIGWNFMFGPWSSSIKVTVLGTFIFWIIYAFLRYKTSAELIAISIAAVLAIIPVIVWCWLFLKYHRERLSLILLAFFAGMLSTVPILFYSELVQRGTQLNFFLFKVIPISFGSSARDFTKQSLLQSFEGTTSVVLATLVTYLIVGVIEELSKGWVLRHSSKSFFRSIDDVLQLSIIVALGFAFAENIANPTYFVGFVQQFILSPSGLQLGPLIGSVVGRSVLTMMVHILSTGVLGYFLGLSLFASPLMRSQFEAGTMHPVLQSLHRILALKTDRLYARMQCIVGYTLSFIIHGIFDFIVSISEVLPGNPSTIGQLIGSKPGSALSGIPITLLPSLLYVIGGFWLLAYLFQRKEDMREFGQIIDVEVVG